MAKDKQERWRVPHGVSICTDCEEIQKTCYAAYYRIKGATIGILACDKHAKQVLLAIKHVQANPLSNRVQWNHPIHRSNDVPKIVEHEKQDLVITGVAKEQ